MTANIILDVGGSNQITIYTTKVEEIYSKKISNITPGQSSANWSAGPKTTKIVDLQRVERRYSIDGTIEPADKTKLRGILTAGGTFVMTCQGENLTCNMDKLTISESPQDNTVDENAADITELDVKFTLVVGENI